MVQFTFLALATAVATATAASAGGVAKKTIKLGDRNLRRGDPATEALLKKATPYNKKTAEKAARRRANENEIDGTYSIKFSECMDIRTLDDELLNEDMIEYAKAGQIVSEKSFVLFHVCGEETCNYDAEDDLYVVDLGTYLANIASYYANKRSDYCEQCEMYVDYCTAEVEEEVVEEAAAEEEVAAEEEGEPEGEGQAAEGEGEAAEGEARKLKKISRKAINRILSQQQIDCAQCATYECFVDEAAEDDALQRKNELDAQTVEWITAISQCQQTDKVWNGMNLYVGANCDDYGDGVELAVYANEECSWYTKENSFEATYTFEADDEGNNVNYYTYAQEFIKSAFYELTPCNQLVFADPNAAEGEGQDDHNEISDYCKGVIENAVSFSDCANDDEGSADQNADQYDWLTYDMKDADNADDVCAQLHKMDEYGHVYDSTTSGSWYKRDKSGNIIRGTSAQGLSGGAIAGIVLAVLALVGAIVVAVKFSKKTKPIDTAYTGGAMS